MRFLVQNLFCLCSYYTVLKGNGRNLLPFCRFLWANFETSECTPFSRLKFWSVTVGNHVYMFHISRNMQTWLFWWLYGGETTFDDDLLNTQARIMTFLWFSDSLWRVVWPELLHCTLCKWLAVKYSDIHQVRLWSQNLDVKDTIVYLVTRSVKRSVCCYRNKRHEEIKKIHKDWLYK